MRQSIIDAVHRWTRREDLNSAERDILRGDIMEASGLFYILSELNERADDPAENPELRGLCVLRRPSRSRPPHRDKQDFRWDFLLQGKNYGVLRDNPILGEVEFKRLSEPFLEKLDVARHSPNEKGIES